MSAIGRRYARAAVEVAKEQGGAQAVDALAMGLSVFAAAVNRSPELEELLLNPRLVNEQQKVLDLIFAQLGLSSQAATLVRVLADRRRIAILDEVVREVEAIADEGVGRLRAQVVSAVPLADVQVKRIAQALTQRFGQEVVAVVAVDPEMLGGLVCRIGDWTWDSSVRRQLLLLREQLEKRVN